MPSGPGGALLLEKKLSHYLEGVGPAGRETAFPDVPWAVERALLRNVTSVLGAKRSFPDAQNEGLGGTVLKGMGGKQNFLSIVQYRGKTQRKIPDTRNKHTHTVQSLARSLSFLSRKWGSLAPPCLQSSQDCYQGKKRVGQDSGLSRHTLR